MYIIVNTKSNYKNCNGRRLKVQKFLGDTIVALVPLHHFTENGEIVGKMIECDFKLSEIVSIYEQDSTYFDVAQSLLATPSIYTIENNIKSLQ